MKVVSTDVVVIGSGLAGLSAAITCKENNLDVIVCSKSSPGLGNCSVMSMGAFRNSINSYSENDHKKATLAAGHSLNDLDKVDALVENAQPSIRKLQGYGVKMKEKSYGYYSVSDGFGKEGISLVRPVLNHAKSLGIQFLSSFFSWDIINIDGEAKGIWGFYKDQKEPMVIRAKAVVLAAGGGGALFARTDNPPGITGDGYAIAYRAGLSLIDMEFVQFYPLSEAEVGKPSKFLPHILAEVGDLVNSNNEVLTLKYNIQNRPLAVASRDSLSLAMALEVDKGLGIHQAIKLDLGSYEERWEKEAGFSGKEDPLKEWFDRFIGSRRSLMVMPVSHFFMGGVVTDSACQTRLPGLFAAGEVMGGVHGANRLGGNALSETVVFGNIAGQKACQYATEGKQHEGAEIETWVGRKFKEMVHANSAGSYEQVELLQVKKHVQRIMWDYAGLIKSETSLVQAKNELKTYEGLTFGQVKTNSTAKFLELKNMLLVAEMVVRASLLRKESRGSHYRSDYPHPDTKWGRRVKIQDENEEMRITI